MRRRRSSLLSIAILWLIPLAILLIIPWAFHIGGRWTPLAWFGSGTLASKGGSYPIFVMFYPSAHMSRLHPPGLRPTAGLAGSACICTSRGTSQYLKLSGTIYNGWPTTEGSTISFRLLEPTVVDVGQQRAGYLDLTGKWQGHDLVMSDPNGYSRSFRSGLHIERASVTLHWQPYWSCSSACESVAGSPK